MLLGRLVGHLAYHVARRRRHIAEVNISLCFPHKTVAERNLLVKQNFLSLGMGLMETAIAWLRKPEDFQRKFRFEGLCHLDEALKKGKGVILVGFHFTTMDLAAALLSTRIQFGAMYRKNNNKLLDQVMLRGRLRNLSETIEREDIKHMIKSLKKGNIIWYGPDQDYGRKHSVFVSFFGVNAATIEATSRIARISGAEVIIFKHFRNPGNKYTVSLSAPLENFPSKDSEMDALRINQLAEETILEHPEQYWWIHRRFKTRPLGQERPY